MEFPTYKVHTHTYYARCCTHTVLHLRVWGVVVVVVGNISNTGSCKRNKRSTPVIPNLRLQFFRKIEVPRIPKKN